MQALLQEIPDVVVDYDYAEFQMPGIVGWNDFRGNRKADLVVSFRKRTFLKC